MNLSLVIPVFDEEGSIEMNLLEIEAYMVAEIGPDSWELIAVNDGSQDGTIDILKRLAQEKSWLKVIDLPHYGRGRALRTGISEASGGAVPKILRDA